MAAQCIHRVLILLNYSAELGRISGLHRAPVSSHQPFAQSTAEDNDDYHRFTSVLNERFSQAQKIQIIENMWRVAFADAHLDTHENHLISKIAGLLHVTHGEYIAAKLHAKQAAGLQS